VKAVIVGCGRVGSNVAKRLSGEGWDVVVIDDRDEALQRLGAGWKGQFVVGHGMDTEVLLRAGMDEADAVVVATNGDNTNIVVAQIAQRRFGVDCVVVRLLDPLRAEFYAQRGMRTFCPTQTAISELTGAVLGSRVAARAPSGEA
jgi:trk system potassium uptake protein TrkA